MPIRIFQNDYAEPRRYFKGTHRARSPAETVDEFRRLMPRLGITRLANVTGLDRIGLPVYIAVRPNSRSLATTQGKGFDHASAKASALMEAIESWHAEHVPSRLRHESYLALSREAPVVDVTRVALRVNAVLRLDVPTFWIEGYDLIQGRATWVPYDSVHTNFVVDLSAEPMFVSSSNGLASGNHLLEAIVHGLCEVIERDSHTLSQFLSPQERLARRVDLDAVDDPHCRQTIDLIRDAGVEVYAVDTTSDLGIPTYGCSIFDHHLQPRWCIKGFNGGHGCHLSPGVALLRALTEAIQSRLTMIAGSRDDIFPSTYESWADPALLERESAQLRASPPSMRFERPSLASSTFDEDVTILLGALRRAGIESAVVVDLTKDDVGIPVVKMVVPGLEGHTQHGTCRFGARALAMQKRSGRAGQRQET